MVAILQVIDDGRIDTAIVTHFDRETIFLYPEVDNASPTSIVSSTNGSLVANLCHHPHAVPRR